MEGSIDENTVFNESLSLHLCKGGCKEYKCLDDFGTKKNGTYVGPIWPYVGPIDC